MASGVASSLACSTTGLLPLHQRPGLPLHRLTLKDDNGRDTLRRLADWSGGNRFAYHMRLCFLVRPCLPFPRLWEILRQYARCEDDLEGNVSVGRYIEFEVHVLQFLDVIRDPDVFVPLDLLTYALSVASRTAASTSLWKAFFIKSYQRHLTKLFAARHTPANPNTTPTAAEAAIATTGWGFHLARTK